MYGLARAKRIDNGQWVEGWYWKHPEGYHHIRSKSKYFPDDSYMDHEIDPTTLAYDTTVPDKDGKPIWGSVPVDGVCEMSTGGDRVEFLQDGDWVDTDVYWADAGFVLGLGDYEPFVGEFSFPHYHVLGPQCERGEDA